MAATFRDLVAEVTDIVDPARLVTREEMEAAVRAERTERYEDHDQATLSALAFRVLARLAAS